MNTPVSFELAKLLKEKGYPFEFITVGELKEVPLNIPTIAEIIMWLYEKHGIWIEVKSPDYKDMNWYFEIHKPYKFGNHYNGEQIYYDSPTEAYKAGIEYTLNNLI